MPFVSTTTTTTKPTDAEIAILRVLWGRGPSTVREVHEALPDRGTGYTTVLKLMQIMAEKGLVLRDESQRSHVYRAKVDRERTEKHMVAEFIDRVFDGSASDLVVRALSAKRTSPEELDRIRALIDAHDRRRK